MKDYYYIRIWSHDDLDYRAWWSQFDAICSTPDLIKIYDNECEAIAAMHHINETHPGLVAVVKRF